jgi:hypothetical protein
MYRYGSNDTLKAKQAVWGDFCDDFVKDMKPLYLLAFLLAANHQDAEHCLARYWRRLREWDSSTTKSPLRECPHATNNRNFAT